MLQRVEAVPKGTANPSNASKATFMAAPDVCRTVHACQASPSDPRAECRLRLAAKRKAAYAAINANSPHKQQAQRFLQDYLSTAEGLRTLNADKPLGAVANLELMDELRNDPLLEHTYASAAQGEIMPDIPEMKRFWILFSSRLGAMLKGDKPIPATLEQIAQRLRANGEIQAWRRRHYPSLGAAQ